MKYTCEFCNKVFNTESEAIACEKKHKRIEAEASSKTEAEKAISNAINAFIAKYKDIPAIILTDENKKHVSTAFGDTLENLEKAVSSVFELIDDMLFDETNAD